MNNTQILARSYFNLLKGSLGRVYRNYIRNHFVRKKMIKKNICLEQLSKVLPRVSLEPTNVCSAHCAFCGYRFLERKKGTMDSSLFELLVDEIIEIGSKELKLTPIVGDPLCDQNIINKIEYASSKKRFSAISMTTNLINLHFFDIDQFVNSGINEIVISTCIANPEVYRRVFGVDAYEKVINNIKNLIIANKKYGDLINVSISLRNEKPAQKTLESSEYKELIAMGAKMEFMWDEYDNWLGLIRIEDLPRGNSFRKVKSRKAPCSHLYTGFIVGYDGNISICRCRDLNMELSIGKYPTVSLREAWQGPKLRKFRENWDRGHVPKICQNCLQYTSVYDHPLLIDTYRDIKSVQTSLGKLLKTGRV